MNQCVRFLIRSYQRLLSPLLGERCRFYPSCSRYAHTAFQEYDFATALRMSVVRICKCGPWHQGGVDLP
jgi:hypothetical protein